MFSYFRASYWDFFDLCIFSKRHKGYKFTNLKNTERRRGELENHDPLSFETKYIKPENFVLDLANAQRILQVIADDLR